MRVSPKYIIQLCQREQKIKLHKRSHKYKERQKNYCMYSRYTSYERGPEEKDKEKADPGQRTG